MTAKQLQVVEARDKVLLVTGGPGSGKTTTALWAGREAIASGEVAPGKNVLYLTFSRSAVSQIARRAPGVLTAMRDRIEVLTFHGLAYRLMSSFGRYAGLGKTLPKIQTEAARKLLGAEGGAFTYDDLVPQALRLLNHPKIWAISRSRWPLVVCDEFQDTGEHQWNMVLRIATDARLILLADPDQMIHSYRPDVTPARLAEARRLAAREVVLEERSHRDPTGVVPAVARAVLNRNFRHEALGHAIGEEKLRVRADVTPPVLATAVLEEVRRLRRAGCRTIGVFGFTNYGSTDLSAKLTTMGVSNTIVGVSESHGEGINAMAVLAGHSVGLRTGDEVKIALATFATACRRGSHVPEIAIAMIGKAPMPPNLDETLSDLSDALTGAAEGKVGDVMNVIAPAWGQIFTTGVRHWRRAYGNFAALAGDLIDRPPTQDTVSTLIARCATGRAAGLVYDSDDAYTSAIQLMNFHQTKGREADGVVLVFRHNDFYASRHESEPFPERSRLLFVAISRARLMVTVILPPEPHALIAPLYPYRER